jgi:hypothetical protein
MPFELLKLATVLKVWAEATSALDADSAQIAATFFRQLVGWRAP